jgi:hypothetical protein
MDMGVKRGGKVTAIAVAAMMSALLLAGGCGGEEAVPEVEAQPEEARQLLPEYTNYWSHTGLP